MQSEKRIFDDLAKMVNGVAGTMAGAGREAEAAMRERIKDWVSGLDLISREEFNAVKAMAAKARSDNEELKKRIAALEKTPVAKKPSVKKPAAKKASTTPKNVKPKKAARKTATKK